MANSHSIDLESSSSQYITRAIAGSTGLDLTSSFTLECWIKPESFGDNTIMGVSNRSGVGGGYFMRYLSGSDILDCKYINSGTDISLSKSNPFEIGDWNHIAFVHNDTTNVDYIYINGVEAATATGRTSNSSTIGALPFRVGARSDAASDYFDGLIDEVRVWNVARSEAEISGNYQTELVGNESGLVLYWKLNNDYTDETSNNNDGTAVNTPSFSTDIPTWAAADLSVSVSDAITVSESVTLTLENNIDVNDAITVSEAVTMLVDFNISVNDTVTVTEAVTMTLENNIDVNDEVIVTEDVSMLIDMNIDVSDAITVAEDITMMMDMSISVYDEVTITESVALEFIGHEISVYDEVTVAENITVENSNLGGISVSDDITVTENINVSGGDISIEVFDSIVVSESREISLENNISVADSVTVTEEIGMTLENNISVSDSVTVSENSAFITVWAPIQGVVHQRSKQQSNPIAMDVVDTITLNNKMQSRPIALDNNEIL